MYSTIIGYCPAVLGQTKKEQEAFHKPKIRTGDGKDAKQKLVHVREGPLLDILKRAGEDRWKEICHDQTNLNRNNVKSIY